jgi:CTP:molybdopterin cytidylyltransferase MocA
MGRPKQMLAYGEGTVLEAVIDAVLESSVDGLVVVVDPPTREFLAAGLPERCFVALNEDPASEMLESAKIGIRRITAEFGPAPSDGVMILPGDQPQVSGGIITTCAEAYRLPLRPPAILIATYGGRRSHPTVLSLEVLAEIEGWSDKYGLNELARLHPDLVREQAITTGAMPIDVNTPDDYQRLLGQH